MMPLLFDPRWAHAGGKRAPTAGEMATGFVCGPADPELFNWLFDMLMKAVNSSSIPCKTELDALDPAVVPAAGVPAVYIDDTLDPNRLMVWSCDLEAYQAFYPGAVNSGEGVSAMLALNPVFPHIETGTNKLTVNGAPGTVNIAAGQTWIWRGFQRFSTDDFDANARGFITVANKTYHLRWHAPGTGIAAPADDHPNGKFELFDMDGLTEDEAQYDSTYDRILFSKVETDGGNNVTVTSLRNLFDFSADFTFPSRAAGTFGSHYQTTADYDLARTPVNLLSAIFSPGLYYDSDYAIYPVTVTRYNQTWFSDSWSHTSAGTHGLGSPGYTVTYRI